MIRIWRMIMTMSGLAPRICKGLSDRTTHTENVHSNVQSGSAGRDSTISSHYFAQWESVVRIVIRKFIHYVLIKGLAVWSLMFPTCCLHQVFPCGNAELFSQEAFRAFDRDRSGTIDFKEFIFALHLTSLASPVEKLKWAFRKVFFLIEKKT